MPAEPVELDALDLFQAYLHLSDIRSRLPSSSVLLDLVWTWCMV